MVKYICKRLLTLIPVLFIVSVLVFGMVHLMPGDPARLIAGDLATEEDIERVRVNYGFDKPLPEQYLNYMNNVLHGDFGISTRTKRPVAQELAVRFPKTLQLALTATLVAAMIGVGIGILSASMRYSILDNISMFIALIGLSIPPFYLGLMLILIFCVNLGWLPISSDSVFTALLLPVVTVSARSMAVIARMTRSSMLEVMNQDYILAAKAQGFSRKKIIFGCALKNAMNAIVTVAGLQFGTLLGGAVVTEKIFGWPGIGDFVVTAIKAHDFQVVQSSILVIALAYAVVNLLIDILYAIINPRIKLS